MCCCLSLMVLVTSPEYQPTHSLRFRSLYIRPFLLSDSCSNDPLALASHDSRVATNHFANEGSRNGEAIYNM